jgi:hypothetical protein
VWVCRRTFAYVEQARAALGITPRSSSAVFVVVGGPPEDPRLLDRRRIDLVGGDLPMQVYHAAAALDVPAAGGLIERWAHAGVDSVARSIGHALRAAADTGYRVVAVGIVANVRDVPSLDVTLRSHPLLHAAEGQLAREVIAEAADVAGLVVHYVSPGGPHEAAFVERAFDFGRKDGPPWRKEHKLAAVAALTALTARRD